MKSAFTATLRQELHGAGADEAETGRLLTIASQLGDLKTGKQVAAQPARGLRRTLLPAGISVVAGLAIGALLVMASQSSLPGNRLYPLKKASGQVAVALHPDYRGVIMMQRAQEVQKLVARHADSSMVLATLADYRSQAVAYKTGAANYSVFEFCKANLRQAEAGATGPERQAISQTVASLDGHS